MKRNTNLFLSGCLATFLAGNVMAQQPKIKLLGTAEIGGSSTDVWSWVDPKTKKEYCAAGMGKNLVIIDVSKPTSPVEVSRISSIPVFDEKVWITEDNKVICYTVSGGGNVQGGIVDLTDPANPKKVGNFQGAHNVAIDEDQGLLILAIPGYAIYDIKTNPLKPQELFSTGGQGHDVTTVGNTLYNFNGGSGTDVWDITDPRNPKKQGGFEGANIKYHHHGFPSKIAGGGLDAKQYLYVCDELSKGSTDDISVLDISDPTDIKKVDGYGTKGTVHNLYVIGDYAYTSYYNEGFCVFDVTDPSKITLADQHDNATGSGESMGGNFGICPYGTNNKMFSNSDGNLYVYDVSTFMVGVEDKTLENVSMEVYPVPNDGVFFVDIKGNITSDMSPRLKVTSLDGKVILDEALSTSGLSNKQVDLTNQSKGVYFVQLQTSKNSINKKVVIR